ncbi:MAG: carboxypeptidase regulatory-like domain-containing protein [Bacteroidales bacterium]|nr:carboxypeptidase regulatory-like domain-containing protein [Bacteroidales bacterium]
MPISNKIKTISILILSLLILSHCKKKEEKFIISGTLKNPYTNTAISGAKVKLSGQKIESGILNANYNLIQSASTDGSGNFSFTFDVAYYSGFQLEFSKENFVNSITEINPDEVQKDVEYKKTYNFYSQAFLRLNITNIFPTAPNDHISYRIINDASGNEGCCSGDYVSIEGPDVNESILCKTYGGHTITIDWIVTEGTEFVNHTHQLTIPSFDTVMYSIVY